MAEEETEAQITNPDGDGGTQTTEDNGKVEFSEQQQAKIQSIVDSTHKRAKEEAKTERDALQADFDAKLKALETKPANPKKDKEGTDSEKEVIRQLQDSLKKKDEEVKAVNDASLETQKNILLMNEISKHQVVNSGEVMSLIRESVAMDEEGVPFIKDGNGYKVNMNGDKMGVAEYIKVWLADRPHHLMGTGGGAGSQNSVGGRNQKHDLSNPETWKNMPRGDFEKLMEEGVEITNMFGNKDVNMTFKDSKNPFVESRKRKFAK